MKRNYISNIKLPQSNLRITVLFILCFLFFLPSGIYSQITNYSFTPAGATGQSGPLAAHINTAYTSTNLNGSVTVNNGIQSFTLPASGLYRITAIGAQGGYTGGYGVSMNGDYSFSAGTVLKILVGQKGTVGTNAVPYSAGGGGGGSYVASPANVPYIIAGGGGGNGDGYDALPLTCCLSGMQGALTVNGNPNPGGINNGTNGNGGICGSSAATAGAGAGFFGDGSACQAASNALSFLNGGKGGAPTIAAGTGGFGGFGGGGGSYDSGTGMRGGGGGGYSGGGGGDTPTFTETTAPAGGGGSYNNGSNQVSGINNAGGDGMVIVSLMCDVNITASGSNSISPLICSGNSLTLTTNATSNYTWSTGNTTSTSIVVSPNANTSYSITGSRLSGCTSTAVINVIVSAGMPTLAVISSTPSTCLGNTVMLTVSGAITHSWTNGVSNGVAFIPNSTVTYTAMGTNGCGTTSVMTTVSIAPLPVTASASSTLTCSGDIVVLTPSGGTSYTWVPGPSVTTNFIVSPLSTTVYTVTGKTGSCVAASTVTVNTNPVPTMSIGASNTTICNGNNVTMTVSGNALSYTWSPGGQVSPVIVVSPANSVVYSVSGHDANGCIGTNSELIIVSQSSFIEITASHDVICIGGSSTITASGAATYTWSHSGENTPETVVSPITTGSYVVNGTNPAGCISTTAISVAVFQPTLSVTGHTSICLGSTITIGASGASSYTWTNDNAVSQYINVSPVNSTTYTVVGTVPSPTATGLSCPATNTMDVIVKPLPVISAGSSYSIICIGKTSLLIADGAGSSGTYTWTNGLGNSPIVSVAPIDNQTYTVTATDANGCKNWSSCLLIVSTCPGFKTIEANKIHLLIYPNPNNGTFIISSSQEVKLSIINELGQQVKEVFITEAKPEIKINDLAKGVYCITGKNDNGYVSQKIIVAD